MDVSCFKSEIAAIDRSQRLLTLVENSAVYIVSPYRSGDLYQNHSFN